MMVMMVVVHVFGHEINDCRTQRHKVFAQKTTLKRLLDFQMNKHFKELSVKLVSLPPTPPYLPWKLYMNSTVHSRTQQLPCSRIWCLEKGIFYLKEPFKTPMVVNPLIAFLKAQRNSTYTILLLKSSCLQPNPSIMSHKNLFKILFEYVQYWSKVETEKEKPFVFSLQKLLKLNEVVS